ncbi:MAG: hypothetical protein KCHDKBKB_00369 [Elusimicrobia bacterium]|nr:hypothetical protein [Elusimicrobiota bacterium]
MSLLDPLIIAQLGNLELRARRILEGTLSGQHENRNHGHARDFSQHRPYNPGDDLRSIDWKVFGRTDRLVVKQYEEQTNIQAFLLLDSSKSMAFSHGGRLSKLEYAKTLAAALGTLVVSQTDSVGLLTNHQHLALGNQWGHLSRLMALLEETQAVGAWDIQAMLSQLDRMNRKRGFVILFSDLMTHEEKLVSSIRRIHAQRHEVLVFQVLDPAELTLPFSGPILFEDMETGEKLRTDPEAIRAHYQAWVNAHLLKQAHVFRSMGIEYLRLTTDTPFDKGLGAYLSWRGIHL